MTVAAILLAGGESSRMGVPKPLLEWGGYTLIEYQLAQLKGPPLDRVVVVLGHRADDVLPYVRSAGARPSSTSCTPKAAPPPCASAPPPSPTTRRPSSS